uniref:Uncharacterized protein n=1 Tax=Eutreptiella gymnastica TaxID=73025 RepID=A0A7S1I825_9EUGL|mmetsp:Transcript_13755/g.24552  ORF Transcript_13755/g.24552 Transcript_13755/m.24552 type:complete len:175 (+) Transcript_13755:46-570(+)
MRINSLPYNTMRIVLFICVVLLFASYYFGDSIQITHVSCLCDPCHAEKMEHNDHNDALVPDIEEARDYDEYVVDDCYEPDSDPDLSDVEAPYSDDEDQVQVGVERGGAVEDGAVEVQDAASAETGVEEECPPANDAIALEAEAEAKTKRFEEMKKGFNRGKGPLGPLRAMGCGL